MINFRILCSFKHFFISWLPTHSLIHLFKSLIHSLLHSIIYSFFHSFNYSFTHSFIQSIIHTFIQRFIHLFTDSFIHLFIHPFTHSFIHLPIHLFIHTYFLESVLCYYTVLWLEKESVHIIKEELKHPSPFPLIKF